MAGTIDQKKQLKQTFLDEWPLERVKEMKLEEYTNLKRDDSFCYWLESTTDKIGSIWGGSAYKFGIYKRSNTDSEDSRPGYSTDGEYAWVNKYGDNVEEAFKNVRSAVVQIIEAVYQNNWGAIDGVDLGDAVKWKIAFLYSDFEVINIFKKSAIYKVAEFEGLADADEKEISELHRYLMDQKPEGVGYFDYTDRLWDSYNERETKTERIKNNTPMDDMLNTEVLNLNTILFGPPGTGKTFHTVNYALSIVDPVFYEENKNDRKELVKRFRELLITDWDNPKQGRIAATTFHQSFTYEDFIEGIKPILASGEEDEERTGDDEGALDEDTSTNEKQIRYTIEDGIFKRISNRARQDSGGAVGAAKGKLKWDREKFGRAEFYKISLGDINIPEDEEIYEYCIRNNRIAIGFLNEHDLSGKSGPEIRDICKNDPEIKKYDCQAMSYFVHNLKEGYYVVIPNGNHNFRAIGKITGGYEYDPSSSIRYNHFREVEWLVTDENLSVDLIYDRNFSQRTIYHLSKKFLKPEFFLKTKASSSDKRSYVLIIDEINRGNIAQIFGELITLIEEDKREGKREELEVSLPYSKKPFSVPSNLYLIGTMNTADRSVEALDTALRRRFQFQEEPPRPQVIAKEGDSDDGHIDVNGEEIFLPDLLSTINRRIEKVLDKDHLIGHSYFMNVEDWWGLKTVFQQNIIPLLEEYFYGDKGKIQLVLGKGFITRKSDQTGDDIFPDVDYEDRDIIGSREVWEIKTDWKNSEEAFAVALESLAILK